MHVLDDAANEDRTVGIRILARSIGEPLRQIVEIAGEDAAVVLSQVKVARARTATTPARASAAALYSLLTALSQ